ncbi:MAG: PaaI family thioesterase [Rhodobacteraceae bacterium]|nr:PaaI family thioesterase [Paracoccaceae bacterium]
MTKGANATRSLDQMPPQSSYAELTGIDVVSVAPDCVVCRMKVTDSLANRNGALHGGALMTLADNAAGTSAFINIPADKTNTTIESKTNFLRSVSVGDTVTARCEPLHLGRTLIVLQITMTRGDGKTAAVTTQTHMILDWSK